MRKRRQPFLKERDALAVDPRRLVFERVAQRGAGQQRRVAKTARDRPAALEGLPRQRKLTDTKTRGAERKQDLDASGGVWRRQIEPLERGLVQAHGLFVGVALGGIFGCPRRVFGSPGGLAERRGLTQVIG